MSDRLEAQWGTAGPGCSADLEQWCAQLLSRFGPQQRRHLRRVFRATVGLTSAYSGCGFFESIVRQLCEHLDVCPPPCIAAWEVNRKARIALRSGPMSPQHCFGNILDMFPKPVVKKMFKVQRVLSSDYRSMPRAGRINNQHLMQMKGDEMLTAFDGLLCGLPLATSAWCHMHQKVCTIPISTLEGFTMHAAGTTCVDFSARSTTRMQVLGQHMVPFTVWAWTRRLHQEQVILHECVVHHPSSALLKRYLKATISLNFEPTSCSTSGSGIHSNSVSRSRILNNIHTFLVQATHVVFSFKVCPSIMGNTHTHVDAVFRSRCIGFISMPLCAGSRRCFSISTLWRRGISTSVLQCSSWIAI